MKIVHLHNTANISAVVAAQLGYTGSSPILPFLSVSCLLQSLLAVHALKTAAAILHKMQLQPKSHI